MKHTCFVCLVLSLTASFSLPQPNSAALVHQTATVMPPVYASQADPKAQATILAGYGKLPLSFEANHGQTDGRVKFLSRTDSYGLFLTGDEAVLALNGNKGNSVKTKTKSAGTAHRTQSVAAPKAGGVLRMKLRNANPAAKVTGVDELASTSNYFIGNDAKKWRTNVPSYAKVKYEEIYSGIDLVYYGNQRQLEYDFIVSPGANPHRIAFDIRGAKRIRRDARGDLVLKVREEELRLHKPVVYQEKDGAQQLVAARYAVTDSNRVTFDIAKYDASRTLYIDPLIYSTYLGGSWRDGGRAIAIDSTGNAYVVGTAASTDFPTSPGAFQTTCNGGNNCATFGDAFVSKINPTGSALVYSTYLGGSSFEYGLGIAVDDAGNAYVVGGTCSTDFPTMNPLQANYGGGDCGNYGYIGDVFVSKINPAGSALVYSTYLGGSQAENAGGIAIDSAGNAYVTGSTLSVDFPTTPGAFQTTCNGGSNCTDAFVSKINATGSALVYSTYLGGTSYDGGSAVAVDNGGNAYITGSTFSTDFPVTPGALQTACNSCFGTTNAFVSKLNPTGSALIFSTYLGGGGDGGSGIVVDGAGDVYVTGGTQSINFPVTPGAFQTAYGGGTVDAFASKLSSTGSTLVYSTYLGGSDFDQANGIAVDNAGDAYVTGVTRSSNFPTMGPIQTHHRGIDANGFDAFLARIDSVGSALVFSTYLGGSKWDEGGGIAVDRSTNAYVTGFTYSSNFPTKNPLQRYRDGCCDAFVAKIDARPATTTGLTSSPNPSTYGQVVTFTVSVTSGAGAPPNGEIISFMKGKTVLGTGTLSGGLATFSTSTLKVGTTRVTAVYGGDSNFASSRSKPVKQVVNQ